MTSLRPSRLVAALVAALFVLALPVGASVGAAADDPENTADNAAVKGFAGCLAAGGQGQLAIVLDTSGSLDKTDHEAVRVDAAKYLVAQLADQVDQSNGDVKLDVAVAGFDVNLHVYKQWTTLTPGTPVRELSQTLDTFKTKDSGFETDYWNAANQTRQYLDDSRDKAGGKVCSAWVWFSDGDYELTTRDTAQAKDHFGTTKDYGPAGLKLTSDSAVSKVLAAGKADLCRPGGVADQLRVEGIDTFAIGLGSDDFSLMQGVAEGTDFNGAACGDEQPLGLFEPASSIEDLIFAFDQVLGGYEQEHNPCAVEACDKGAHQFVLDPFITHVHVLADIDGTEDFHVELQPPTRGPSLTIHPNQPVSQTLGSADVMVKWLSGRQFQLDLTHQGAADAGWTGPWRMYFINQDGTGQSRSNLHLYGDVKPVWPDADQASFTVGDQASLQLGVARENDEPVTLDASVKSDVQLKGSLTYADGTEGPPIGPLTAATLAQPIPLDLSQAKPGPAILHLELDVTTAPFTTSDGTVIPGTALDPASIDYPVKIAAPPDFPTVPDHVSFGKTDEEGDLTASLPVTGAGCVWLKDAKSRTTPGTATTGVSSSADSNESCVSDKLPLTLSIKGVGTGLGTGLLTVDTRPDRDGVQPVEVTVSYTFDMQRPRNGRVFVVALILIMAVGILLPVGILYLVKWWTARIPDDALSIGSVRGQVGPGSSFPASATLGMTDLRSMTLVGTDRRSVQLNGTSSLVTKPGLGISEPGYTVVEGQNSVSSRAPYTDRKRTHARLPLALRDAWVALLDTANPQAGDVEVVFLVAPSSGRLPELLEDARATMPEAVEKLRQKLREGGGDDGGSAPPPTPPVTGASDDWGGPAPTAPPAPPSAVADDWGSGPSTTPSGPPTTGGSGNAFDEW